MSMKGTGKEDKLQPVTTTQYSRQFWDCGRWKSDSLWNFSIVGCQWTVNCLLGIMLGAPTLCYIRLILWSWCTDAQIQWDKPLPSSCYIMWSWCTDPVRQTPAPSCYIKATCTQLQSNFYLCSKPLKKPLPSLLYYVKLMYRSSGKHVFFNGFNY